MNSFYRAWSDDGSICQQSVGKFEIPFHITEESPIRPQAVGKLEEPILPPVVAELPWGHNTILLERLVGREERLWYAKMALENGWPRRVLIQHIAARLHLRQGNAQTNFALALPAAQAKLAQEALKDEYALDFLTPATRQEKDIEQGIIENTQRFLMELGKGFAFVGRQVRLPANGQEHVVDLLLYNIVLHSYIVVELKAGPFKTEHVSKLSAYLTAADAVLRREGDDVSIGMILCRSKNKVAVEYALRDQRKPIGVACYRLTKALPGPLAGKLPSARELEKRLNAL